MASSLADFGRAVLEREQAEGFPSLPDAALSITLPLSQAVVDDLILAGRPDDYEKQKVRGFRLHLLSENHIALDVTLHVLFKMTSTIRVEGRVEPEVPFPHDGKLRIAVTSGPFKKMLLNALPRIDDWLKIDGSLVMIDLVLLLRRGELGWLIPLIARLRLDVSYGQLMARLDLKT